MTTVYMYTGITSAGGDQSNVGFLLSNQRTKETRYYHAPGAIEESARDSAEGVVQDLRYTTTFPLLLNVAGEPTYFMSLKDASQLVKMYAMVNVEQYQLVATGTTVSECENKLYSPARRTGRGRAPKSCPRQRTAARSPTSARGYRRQLVLLYPSAGQCFFTIPSQHRPAPKRSF